MSLADRLRKNPPPNGLLLQEEMRETPAAYQYYPQALAHGLVNPDGTMTGRGVDLAMGRDHQALVIEGLVKDDDNIIKTFTDSLGRNSQEIFAAYAETAGRDDISDVIHHRIALNGELAKPQWSDQPVATFVDLVGAVLPEMAAPVAAVAATGSPTAGIMATYARLWGDNLKGIKETAPNLTQFEAAGINTLMTGFQAFVEHGFGLETRLASILNRSVKPQRGLAAYMKSEAGMSRARRAAGEFFSPTNPLTGAVGSAFKETIEETVQAASEIVTHDILGAEPLTAKELADRLFWEPLQAIPAGLVLGSFTYSRNAAKASTAPSMPTPEEVLTMHSNPTTGEINEESVAAEDQAFSQLTRDIEKVPNVKNAQEAVDTIRAMSWAFARAARARGEQLMPIDFIESLKTAFIDDNLDPETISGLITMINDPKLDPLEKTNAILKLLGQRAGEQSAVMRVIRDVNQEMEASILEDTTRSLLPYLNSLVPPLRDTKAQNIIKKQVTRLARKIVGSKQGDIYKSLSQGKTVAVSIDQLEEVDLGADLYARLVVEPQTFSMFGRKIHASAHNGLIVLKYETILSEEQQTAQDERTEAEKELRVRREAQTQQQPLNAVIESDIRLGFARQNAFDTFSKYTSLADEMDNYRARIGVAVAKAGAARAEQVAASTPKEAAVVEIAPEHVDNPDYQRGRDMFTGVVREDSTGNKYDPVSMENEAAGIQKQGNKARADAIRAGYIDARTDEIAARTTAFDNDALPKLNPVVPKPVSHVIVPKALRTYTAEDIENEMVKLSENLPEPIKTDFDSRTAQLEARRKNSIPSSQQSRYDIDVDENGWETVPDNDGFPNQWEDTEYQKNEHRNLNLNIKPDTGGRHVAGRKVTKPSRTYEEGKGKAKGNVWVRQTPRKSNHGRVLLVQISNRIINPRTGSVDEAYYDALYNQREDYVRSDDFWEAPLWAATAAYSMDNADLYVVRDLEEAKKFFAAAEYDDIWFSAVEVNKDMINELAQAVPEQAMTVGGYVDEGVFTSENITFQDSIETAVKAAGKDFKRGTDYRHLLGTPVVPRLVMSNGCLHQCAFCTVPKNIEGISLELIDQQVESFAALKTKVVYLNDKTFGQSPNYKYLPTIFERMKAANPDFEGFIVQTTTSALVKLTPQYLAASGIKYVELGIETVNDPILKKNRKPSSVKLIDQSAKILRKSGIALIPNIIIGLPEETAESYANTMDWLERNRDIVSHLNIYNLAVYQNTQLAEDLEDRTGLVDSDFDENVREKSFHKDHQIHEEFADQLFAYGQDVLKVKPLSMEKPAAKPRAPLTALIGERAQEQPVGLTPAIMLDGMGESMDKIQRETGWRKAKDGKWRYEIDDSQMKFDSEKINQAYKDWRPDPKSKRNDINDGIQLGVLSDFLDHPQLFKHYPDMADVPIFARAMPPSAIAAYAPALDEMYINERLIKTPANAYEQDMVNMFGGELKGEVLIHEIQHAIQAREHFASGFSPQDGTVIAEMLNDTVGLELAPRMIALAMLQDFAAPVARILAGGATPAAVKEMGHMIETVVQTDPAYAAYFENAQQELKKPELQFHVVQWLSGEFTESQLRQSITKLKGFPRNPMEVYQASAGENEAFMVGGRVDMTPLERKLSPYQVSYPVPEEKTFVLIDQEAFDIRGFGVELDGTEITPSFEMEIDGKEVRRPMFSVQGQELRGLYLPQANLQLFFQNADESTVLHEFLHHARTILPEDIQDTIIEELDVDGRGIWTTHIEEAFVDSILLYIRDGKLQPNVPERYKAGIEAIIPVLKEMSSLNQTKLSPDLSDKLDTLFTDVEVDDLQQIDAAAAQADLDQEGPTAEQSIEIINETALADFEPPKVKRTGRNAAYARIYAIAAKVTNKPDFLVHQVASETFTWFNDTSSLTQLSEAELKRLAVSMSKKYDVENAPDTPASVAIEQLVEYESTKKDVHQDRRIKYTTRAKERAYSYLNNWRKIIDKHDINFTSPKFLAVILDDYANDGPWHRNYADKIDNLQHESAKELHTIGAKLHNMARAHGLDLDQAENRRVELGGYTATVGRAVLLALANINVNGEISNAKKAIMESNDIKENEFADASAFVQGDKEAQALMKYMKEGYEFLYASLAPVYERIQGEPLKKVPNYFALLRVDGMFSRDDTLARSLEYVNQYGQGKAANRYSMTKERTAIRAGSIDLDHALAGLRHYTTQAANYIAKADTVKELGNTINSEEIATALLNSYGRDRGAVLHDLLRDMLSREMFPNARTEVMTDHDRFFAWARQSFTMAMLGFRPMVWLAQLISKPTFYSLMKGALLPATVMQDLSNTWTLQKALQNNSFENARRAKDNSYKTKGYVHYMEGTRLLNTAEDGTLSGLWPKYARHILESHGNPVTGDIIQHGFKGVLAKTFKGVSIGEMALGGITTMDVLTVGSVWLTSFDMIVDKEMEKHGNLEKAKREAARYANDLIAKTQPPRTQFQRPQALTGREGVKLLFPFSGQTMQNWQIWNNEVVRPTLQALGSGDFKAFFKGKGEYESGIAQRLALAFVIPAILMGMRARRRAPDEEELMMDLMFYPISSIPAIGGAISYMFVHEADWATIELAHTRVLNNTITAVYDIAKAVTGDEKFDTRSLHNLEDAIAIPMSIPTAAIRFTEETLKMLFMDDVEFDVDYVMRAISAPPKPKKGE